MNYYIVSTILTEKLNYITFIKIKIQLSPIKIW